jgi:mRNA interferase RelE/StbE
MQKREGGGLSLKYKIFETRRFSCDLKLLARSGHAQLEEKLHEYVYQQLKEEPHFGLNIKKLRGWTPTTWRYRVGNWRFFYIINEETHVVSMITASHRKEAYR